ncbi:MAG: hydrogenase [Sterolibacterium sp.]|jgi:hydrogenase-1 operon protein HyaE
MSELLPTPDRSERLTERFAVMRERHGYTLLDRDGFDAFAAAPGAGLILFAEELQKIPETWDLMVILPEVVATLDLPLRVGILAPETARSLAPRYGIRVWPALLAVRDGGYLGVLEGLKDWSAYSCLIPELLAAQPSRLPGMVIPVHHASASTACH